MRDIIKIYPLFRIMSNFDRWIPWFQSIQLLLTFNRYLLKYSVICFI